MLCNSQLQQYIKKKVTSKTEMYWILQILRWLFSFTGGRRSSCICEWQNTWKIFDSMITREDIWQMEGYTCVSMRYQYKKTSKSLIIGLSLSLPPHSPAIYLILYLWCHGSALEVHFILIQYIYDMNPYVQWFCCWWTKENDAWSGNILISICKFQGMLQLPDVA
jgi:hypothetical protein